MATLTGAQMIATGLRHAGILTPSESVEKLATLSGKVTDELTFPLLYAPEILNPQFESSVADMKNRFFHFNCLALKIGYVLLPHVRAISLKAI